MRVLVATVTAGGGHLAAAAALEEAWRARRGRDVVERVDLLQFVSKLQRKLYAEGYVQLVERAPEVYGMAFRRTDDPKKVQKPKSLRRRIAFGTNKRFVQHLAEFKPDVVLCTHYLPLEILAHLRAERAGPHPLTVCVVTDLEAHAFWMEPHVDLWCVAAEETKASLVARGAKEADIAVTGIPIAGKFSAVIDVAAVRRRYGWRDDLPVVLVLGGGFGMGPVASIVEQLDKVTGALQAVVVAGRNEALRESLAALDRTHPTDILGFCGNMHELMTAADLIVTKPGGLTTSEALAIGRPLCILQPIPGQETANADYLLERGAAIKVNRPEDLPFRLEQLLGSKKLRAMAQAAAALGKPRAAEAVCEAVLRRAAAG